jgi:putative transport protein
MHWFGQLNTTQPIAAAILVLSGVIILGLALGSLRVRRIGLGVAGVLFAGIFFGHCGLTPSPGILGFVREFGLILFVYTIGMQVGPGFLSSLKRQGLPLNLLAGAVVVLGGVTTLVLARLLQIDVAAAVGIFAGATTNTPALGAAQEALRSLPDVDAGRAGLPALGYAVAYPFGIIGIILSMLVLRAGLRGATTDEPAETGADSAREDTVERMTIVVTNANLNGLKLHQIPGKEKLGVIVSRIRYAGESEVQPANAATVLHVGDTLLAVGRRANLEEFCLIVGRATRENLTRAPGRVVRRRFVVTNKEVLGKTLRELTLTQRFGVTVTRVTRADIEMTAVPNLKLQFGDMVQVVGNEADLDQAATALGNSVAELNHTNLIPLFVGIGLGVLVGLLPFSFGGMPTPVRLGLAGGPLLAAIVLSRIGRIGPLLWYMPVNANTLLRELGIALFLACAGLKAGEHFFEVLLEGSGWLWMACGAVVTLLPMLVVSLLGRRIVKLNFANLCGLLAGSMTDPPALAFANSINRSDAPAVAYATVYPFTMLLRIVTAQLLVLLFCR